MKNVFKISGIIILCLSILLTNSCKKKNPTPPVVTTSAVSAITQTTAICGGDVTSEGTDTVIARGVCWNTTVNPVINDSHTTDGLSTGSFVSNITGLSAYTTYHLRAYATNSAGTGYGNDFSFTTPATSLSVTDLDLNLYNTVTIGTQIWMVENLRTTKYNDNTPIPLVADINTWASLVTPGFSWYNNDEASYKLSFGALYNWFAVDSSSNGGKNVCPVGWHVPTFAEWTTLTTYLGGDLVAGGKLKETGTTIWANPNKSATNETGFSALPGGSRDLAGTYVGIGSYGIWWSRTEEDSTYAWRSYMDCNVGSVVRGGGYKPGGFSVRCLKDN
jgi:uncharacterized protein (TIGR02145 family)